MHCHGFVNLEPLGYKFMALWTVYEMAYFFVTLDGNGFVIMHNKFQQSVHKTVVVPRFKFIDGVGHCSCVPETGTVCNCADEREDSSVQFFGVLLNARRCATTGVGVLTVLFLWRCRYCRSSTVVDIHVVVVQTALGGGAAVAVYRCRRYPCCGTEAVWGNCAKTVNVHRLRFLASFRVSSSHR